MLLGRKGWGSLCGWFLKKYFILLDLSNLEMDSDWDSLLVILLGTNVSPNPSTLYCVIVSCLCDRFVTYVMLST